MTPEEIRKEQEASKSNPIKPASAIRPDKADIEEQSTPIDKLKTSKPVDTTPPAESDKEYGNKVKDYKTIVSEAKAKGIDLNDQEGVPLLDSDKEKIIQNASKLAPKELVSDVVNRINTYAQPELKNVPELDQKRLMDQQRKIRRARWGDALYAFGEGLQGRTANPEAFATTRIQRQKDKEFQDYLATTEENRRARNLWNAQTTNETIKWLDEQANNERLDKITRDKMQAAADQFRQKMQMDADKFGETKRHNKAMENKKTGRALEKDMPVTVQTAKNVYQLKPEEAAFYKGEVLKNSEAYRSKYPGLFEKVQATDEWTGKPIEGKFTYKLNPRIKDVDLVRAYLEENQEGGQKITEDNQQSYLDKYRKKLNIPTSDIPVSQTIKTGQQKIEPKQQAQPSKADPLGLGF